MEKLKNKNTIVLLISGLLILVAIIIAIVASTTSADDTGKTTQSTEANQTVDIDLQAIANGNKTTTDTSTKSAAEASNQTASYKYSTGTYKIATKDDPLGLRLEPNTTSDRLVFIPIGEEVEVIAIWEDWGYVVYGKTGGWLSMNYLELVGTSKKGN